MIHRALIQNMYLQMQSSFLEEEGSGRLGPRDGFGEQMEELLNYFLMFTENLNLTVQYVVDQLGQDPETGEVGGAYVLQMPNRDPGPGGSPVDVQGSSSVNIGPPSNLLSSSRDLNSPRSPGQALRSQEDPTIWAQRFVKALRSCQFLFQDKFIKSLLHSEKDLGNKLKFLERVHQAINPHNYEFLRKICWHISKIYYEKATQSQQGGDLSRAQRENEAAALFLRRYEEHTKQIEQNFILMEAQFLANDAISEATEVEKHGVRIENLQEVNHFLLYERAKKRQEQK